MTRSDVDDDALFDPVCYVFKNFSEVSMVWTHFIAGVHVLNEVKKVVFAQFLRQLGLVRLSKVSDTPFFLVRQHRQCRFQPSNVTFCEV